MTEWLEREASNQHAVARRDVDDRRYAGAADGGGRVDRAKPGVRVDVAVRKRRLQLRDVRVSRVVEIGPVEHVLELNPEIEAGALGDAEGPSEIHVLDRPPLFP